MSEGRNCGLTIMELLVVILLISIIGTAIFLGYNRFLRDLSVEFGSAEMQFESNVGLELLRLDLEHAGYGLARYLPGNNPNKPIEYDSENKELTIRSTLNNTNRKTLGWVLFECNGAGNWTTIFNALKDQDDDVCLVAMDRDKTFKENVSFYTCPDEGARPAGDRFVYIGFPYECSDSDSSGCEVQFCNVITYRLSADQNLAQCHPQTRNLLRAVGNGNGLPLLSCVADFQVFFHLDDGDVTNDISELSVNELKKKIKMITVYLLVQEGGLDPDYSFDDELINDFNDSEGSSLQLPNEGYEHYRWRAIKFTVIPVALGEGI